MNSSVQNRRAANLCIAVLLALNAVLGVDTALRTSVTHDEYWHLPVGLLSWKTGRFDFDGLNPPLTRMWDTLPVLASGVEVDVASGPARLTEIGDRFLAANRERYDAHFALARSMNVVWSVLTGLILAYWSRELFGDRAACLTTALWCCCPSVLAHAALVTPDAGGACLFTATLFAAWRFAGRPGWQWGLIVGAMLGLAQLAKFTNILLYAIVPVIWFFARREATPDSSADPPSPISAAAANAANPPPAVRRSPVAGFRRFAGMYLFVVAVSVAVLNAGFLFHGTFREWGGYRFTSRALAPLNDPPGVLTRVRIPLPNDFLQGLDAQRRMMEGGHPVFLDGQWSESGFRDYFIRALAYKLPHATELLLLLWLCFTIVPGTEQRLLSTQAMLVVPLILVVVVASAAGMQLGVRYLLPVFPLLFLLAGQSARWLDWRRFRIRTVLVCTAALALPLSLRHHPQHLAYFNEASGGPLGGRQHLLDSNTDWGQDLRALARYLDEQEVDEVGLAYFGMVPPSALGIRYHIPAWPPTPGWYAISVNFLEGRPHTIRNPDGSLRSADFGEFAWLRSFRPTAHVGYSIDVFRITDEDLWERRRRLGLAP